MKNPYAGEKKNFKTYYAYTDNQTLMIYLQPAFYTFYFKVRSCSVFHSMHRNSRTNKSKKKKITIQWSIKISVC